MENQVLDALTQRRDALLDKLTAINQSIEVVKSLELDKMPASVNVPPIVTEYPRPSKKRPWSKAEDRKLKSLATKGLTDAQIADKLNRNRGGVGARRKRIGIAKRKPRSRNRR